MDKQKQIEEMAKETCWQQIYPCGDDRPFCFLTHEVCKCCKDNQCDHYEVCERIYNAGYRKIPENAVVLTGEEYKKLESLANDKCHYDCHLIDYPDFEREKMLRDDTRKETAEKFAERLKADVSEDNELHEALNAYLKRDYFEYIDERCKEFTEGV